MVLGGSDKGNDYSCRRLVKEKKGYIFGVAIKRSRGLLKILFRLIRRTDSGKKAVNASSNYQQKVMWFMLSPAVQVLICLEL